MKSAASIKGHPIHPILITLPVAFFTGTLLFDILGVVKMNLIFLSISYYLEICGIVGGLLAAIPGTIDYFAAIPPDSSAKKRGIKHGLINSSVIIVFAIALFLKQTETGMLIIIAAEVLGFAGLCIASCMGGTLVYRNMIGVYNRYADGGKWSERKIDTEEKKVEVAAVDELKVNQMKLIQVQGKRIVVARNEQGHVAFDDHCSHKGGSLAAGVMICNTVQCPWHGSQFSTVTGDVKAGPAKEKITIYKLAEENGKVYLLL